MRRHIKHIKHLAVVLCVLACAGCVTMPTSGPVLTAPREILEEEPGGFTIEPEPPPQGAPPSMIIRGFLTAMASVSQDYATAREYLTVQASAAWHPTESDSVIYASGTTPSVEESSMQVTMSAPQVGYLHPDGSFVSSEDPMWIHDFGMVQEDGEWRISTPPQGLALSQYMFTQSYMRIDAYFFPSSGETLVPDPRYVPRTAWDRTTAARLVVDGPSDWLRDIVSTGARTGVSLDGDVTLSGGIADVPMECGPVRPSTSDATQLAIEIAATMRDMAGVSRVRLSCDGTPVPLAGASQDASLPISIVDNYDSSLVGSTESLAAVHDGIVALMTESGFVPVPGEWGSVDHTIDSFALSSSLDNIAAVTDQGLMIGSVGEGPLVLAIPGEGFLRPQLDSRGNLWAAEELAQIDQVEVLCQADAFFGGGHDVVVARRHWVDGASSRADLASSGTLTPDEHEQYIRLTIHAMKALYDANRYTRYVAVFQNWLKPAGASFDHLHKQLVSIDEHGANADQVLSRVRENLNFFNECGVNYANYHNLVIAENDSAIAFAGFGHRYPTVEIYSKSAKVHPWEHSQKEVRDMSDLIHALHTATGAHVPSNEEWHHVPVDVDVPMPWRINIKWRISTVAGFEGDTKIYINTISPHEIRDIMTRRLLEMRAEGRIADMRIADECSGAPNPLKYNPALW